MGFLSKYVGVERYHLDEEWWVDLKICLSEEELAACRRALVRPVMKSGETSGEMNTSAYMEEMLTRSIDAWNLTDEHDQPLPIHKVDPKHTPGATDAYHIRRQSVRRLPGPVFSELYAEVKKRNEKDDTKDVNFRDGGESRDQDGEYADSSGELQALYPGAIDVEGTGLDGRDTDPEPAPSAGGGVRAFSSD